jgi:hypothetical protein
MRNLLATTLALALASGSVSALESATTGSQATQATVGALNSKIDMLAAQLQASNNCNAQRKFYAPADPKKDANSCVGVGDYDLNMASTSNINLIDGVVSSTRVAANQYAGYFTGNTHALRGQANTYGLVGVATGTGGVGIRGDASATNGWGGYFTGYYGVVGISNGGIWGVESYGYGSGTGSVYIGNDHGNAQLCLNGICTTAVGHAWGGDYGTQYGNGWSPPGFCDYANPYTGGCSCPPGYNVTAHETGQEVHWVFIMYTCYK